MEDQLPKKSYRVLSLSLVNSAQGTQSMLPTTVGKDLGTALHFFKEHSHWGPGLGLWSLLAVELLFSEDLNVTEETP